uniref:Uncharacterized protein n=1 Tax=Mycobacterium riyadhense TaxID=486698 RepID=A0A653EZZ9_9MYCO|nr:hypothetical protein BIN_B_04460 [Mycobacterium riyadhense]
MIGAWVAVIVCGAAAAASAVALATPAARPTHTVIVSPTFTPDQVAAAKKQACDAWERASTVMAEAGGVVAKAPRDWGDPVRREAIAAEARIYLVEGSYLRSQIAPATPAELTAPLHDYFVASADMENATMQMQGHARSAAIDRANIATRQANSVCGLS